MKKVIQTEEPSTSFSSSEHHFQPREDDEENLWDVIEILKEKKHHYFVKWAGVDPQTGKPWASSWVGKGDVTDDLVEKWKTQKAEKKERAAARRKKSGKRASTGSTTRTNTGSTRLSVLTTNSSTPTTANVAGPSSRRRTVRLAPIKDEESLDDEASPPVNQAVLSGSANGARKGWATKESERHKRKRDSSIESTSSRTSLPAIVSARKSNIITPPARPWKKRRLDSVSSVGDDSQEESRDIKRGAANGRNTRSTENEVEVVEVVLKNTRVIASEEEEDDDEIVATPLPSRKTKSKSRLEQELDSSSRVNRPREPSKVVVHDKRAETSPPLRRTAVNGTSTGKTGLNSFSPKMASGEIQPGTRSSKSPLIRFYDGTVRELSPDTTRRLKQFDAELRAIEAERRKQEAEEAERRAKQAQAEAEESDGLEYCDEFPVPAAPFDHPPEPSPSPQSPAHPPLSNPEPPSTRDVYHPVIQPRASKKKVITMTSDDSYRQGIVPETELEDSGNTQSQELSQSQSQAAPPAGSPPSMAVEPPASLRSPAPTPSRPTIISKMRPRTPTSRSESLADLDFPHIITLERIDEELQGASQDADESAAFDSIEQESLEIPKKQQTPAPIEDKDVRKNGKEGAGAPAHVPNPSGAGAVARRSIVEEDIEQFTSPEKRARASLKPDREGKGKRIRTSSPESDAIRKHGMELANAARQAKLQNRPQAPRRSLADVLQKHKLTSTAMTHLSTTGEVPMSSIGPPSSGSVLVPDSESGLADVPEEVVREMERAYVDLDGGATNRMDEDTLEDMGSSQRPADGGRVVVLAIREEEEESTQDLLREAAGEQAQCVEVPDAEAVPRGGIELGKSPREQERSVSDNQIASDMRREANDVQSLPRTSSDRADKLEALLQQEQMRNQELAKEIASLRQALDLAKGINSNQQLAQQLREVEGAHEQAKAAWDAKRTSLTAAAEDATKAKESALKDVEFFRGQYARASGYVTSTREENQELEKRAKIAEDQAKSGVAMIKATYENKIKELEKHMEKWQTMATFLIQKDHRTDNDQLRQRAAEHPELKAKCQSLEEGINFLSAEISQLEMDRDSMASELEHWKQEAERSSAELNNSRADMERFIQASSASGEMVYRCLWRTEENKPCDEVVQTIEELRNHLFSAGHIRVD